MTRITIILLALLLDLVWGDPPNRFHPLLLMGRWLSWGRRLAPPHRRFWFGAGWTLVGMALFALPFWKLEKRTNYKLQIANCKLQAASCNSQFATLAPLALPIGAEARMRSSATIHHSPFTIHYSQFIIHPFLLKPVFAYRNLRRAVGEVGRALAADDLSEGRRLLGWHLVSRDTGQLSAPEVAGAAIESLAENLTDSLTAPLLAYAIGGLPAAWAYRFVNTADAMWGYRTAEFEELGKFPARLDDGLNWLPARLTGWLLVVAAWLAGEDGRNAARTMLSQHGRTTSLNAGWTMSAMAGALGVTLSKRDVYELVGGSATADAAAIRRALWVADICLGLNVILLIALTLIRAIKPSS
jgi:adenosylcobinamide-phosphate synthase